MLINTKEIVMLKLENAYKEFMIKKGTDVLRFDKNGRKYADIICLQDDLYVSNDFYLGLEKCDCCDAISAKFAVGNGYMVVEAEDLIGFFE